MKSFLPLERDSSICLRGVQRLSKVEVEAVPCICSRMYSYANRTPGQMRRSRARGREQRIENKAEKKSVSRSSGGQDVLDPFVRFW